MSKEAYWRVTWPGGDDRYVFTGSPTTVEDMRETYPKAIAFVALPKAEWMAESGRAYGVPAVK